MHPPRNKYRTVIAIRYKMKNTNEKKILIELQHPKDVNVYRNQ
jgi:hypothetical protein